MDKVQKIRKEVERLRNELIQEKEKGYGSDVDDACILELQNVLTYIDSLQKEPCNSCQGFNDKDKCDELVFTHNCPIVKNPVSIWHDVSEKSNEPEEVDNPCKIRKNLQKDIVIVLNGQRHRQVLHKGCFSKKECKEKCSLYERCQRCCIDLCMIFFHDPHCHFEAEPVSEDLEAEIDKYVNIPDNQGLPDFRRELSDCARHFAKWQKKQMEKEYSDLNKGLVSAKGVAVYMAYETGKKEVIAKACKYLQEHREEVDTEDNGISGWISDEFIEKFKKYMNG